MSDTHGLIPHQTGYYFITLEEDYIAMFEASARRQFEVSTKTEEDEKRRDARLAHAVAKAYISSVHEHLTNLIYKTTGSAAEAIWVFLSFPELEQRLHGAYKMRTLKDAMKELIEDGYVLKRPNSDPRFKALEYRMNLEQYRQELNALPKKMNKRQRANLHSDSAKMHDDGANLHAEEGKNALSHRADSHARINRRESTERFNSEQQRANESSEQVSVSANKALALLASLFHLSVEEAQKVFQVAQELQQRHKTLKPPDSTSPPSQETGRKASDQKEMKQPGSKTGGEKTQTMNDVGEPPWPSARALVILDAWDRVNGKKMPRIQGNRDATEELAKIGATEDDLKNVRDRLLAQKDKGQEISWWESRGVRLKDVAEHFDLASLGPLPPKGAGRSGDQHRNVSTSGSPPSTGSPTESKWQKRKLLKRISGTTATKSDAVAAGVV
jgi:hypothetical protein